MIRDYTNYQYSDHIVLDDLRVKGNKSNLVSRFIISDKKCCQFLFVGKRVEV